MSRSAVLFSRLVPWPTPWPAWQKFLYFHFLNQKREHCLWCRLIECLRRSKGTGLHDPTLLR